MKKHLQELTNNRFHVAVSILCEEYDLDANVFFSRLTRQAKIVEARRFLIYYCFKELNIKKSHISKYILILKNHATMLHHIKQHEAMTMYEKKYCDRYNEFIEIMKHKTQIYNYE